MKVDLHVHSKYSKRPSVWLLQKIGCPESFTDPVRLYQLLRERGMTLVTITDHNVIDGCLEIAHLPGAFISEEVTSYFPEDGCKIHVLTWNITEAQHEEIQRLRENLYDLLSYCRAEGIVHSFAHPMYKVNERLSPWHLERAMLLFRNLEINGEQDPRVNAALRRMVQGLSPESIERLADKHGFEPVIEQPWNKNFTAGSDDHSSLHAGNVFTEVAGADGLQEFFGGIARGHAQVHARPASPHAVAINYFAIAYQFYKQKTNLSSFLHKDMLLTFMDRILRNRTESVPAASVTRLQRFMWRWGRAKAEPNSSAFQLLRREAQLLLEADAALLRMVADGPGDIQDVERHWFNFGGRLTNKVLGEFAARVLDRLAAGHLFDLFHAIGSAAALYAMLAPWFVAYSLHRKHYRFSRDVERAMAESGAGEGAAPEEQRVGHFSDTFFAVNGVARTLQRHVSIARATGRELKILTCGEPSADTPNGVRVFRPVATHPLPEYPEFPLNIPPLLEMIEYVFQQDFTHLVSSTPGPVGLAALGVARILKLPIYGIYTTAVPQYTQALTDDDAMEGLMWRFIIWYYDQMDAVLVNSKASADELIEKGISADKIHLLPRGVDVDRFHPSLASDIYTSRWQLPDGPKLLYAGRVSREKDLPLLCKAFRQLHEQRPDAWLVVAGDGPYRKEMERELEGLPVLFTGYLEWQDLAKLYAASDLFVFPSTTDTFGNVVLEAQSSACPIVVSDEGGPCENLWPDRSGVIVREQTPEAWCDAMLALLNAPERLRQMAQEARRYAQKRSWHAAFGETWDLYRSISDGTPQTSEKLDSWPVMAVTEVAATLSDVTGRSKRRQPATVT